jgi:hypothetical protein
MKTRGFLAVILTVALLATGNTLKSQTVQKDLTVTFDNLFIACTGRSITGTWVAHFTFHLGKDGKIDRMHWNTLHQDLYDDTGEKAMCLDAGNDNLGINFQFFNTPNASNGIENFYDVPDGWLDEWMPETLPEEGTYAEMNWKFKVGGNFYGFSYLMRLNKNAQGDVTVDFTKSRIDCI